ncbi:amino acid synthesis family protein [Leucobacter rhizosphaerae]|uniref:Amino acid synthesis family protein n=1 Tax=Leucobacter rhizosphaerae TaxID=2932245 RepID=A0ABY4FTI8_9MICO|nr:amino acid synthesis family protein [Leucobacter rhizosphaerae]UOQ59590.1 amino acid synthesis family protein [Leucobacter rhizosphaerae]
MTKGTDMRVRKISTVIERVFVEGGRAVPEPLTLCAAAAVIPNPWVGRFAEDLGPEVRAQAPELALLLTQEILSTFGSADRVAAFGKGAIVGIDGELEHGSAFLHTPYFGNIIRERLGSDQYISYADRRAAAGAHLTVPLADTVNSGIRSHFITFGFSVPDAPAADELVIAVVAATGGRPHARIGDRTTDRPVALEEYRERARAIGIDLGPAADRDAAPVPAAP